MNTIIEIFAMNEIKKVIEKFQNINKDEEMIVKELVEKVENEEVKEELLKDYKETLKVARLLKDEKNISKILEMYSYIKNTANVQITIEEVKEYFYELMLKDAIRINEEYIIYKKGSVLKEFCKEILKEMLTYSFHWDRIFDKDEIIEYLMDRTSTSEIIEELLYSNDIEELLGLNPSICFELNNDNEYYFSAIEI